MLSLLPTNAQIKKSELPDLYNSATKSLLLPENFHSDYSQITAYINSLRTDNLDPISFWEPLESGLNSVVYVSEKMDSSIIIGGEFTSTGNQTITLNRIAKWNNSGWIALGTGITGLNVRVYSIITDGNYVYAGGKFTTAGGVFVNNISRWDGTIWQSLGGGVNGTVSAMIIFNNELYIGGYFNQAGGVPCENIAKWNGSNWTSVGDGFNNTVRAFSIFNNELYAAGDFILSGTNVVNHLARWNGTGWTTVGGGTNQPVYTLAAKQNELFAGGAFSTAGSISANAIARWNGVNWDSLKGGLTIGPLGQGIVYSMDFDGKKLFVGGLFTNAGGIPVNSTCIWDQSEWLGMGGGVNNVVFSVKKWNEAIYFGGSFSIAGAVPANNIALWRSSSLIYMYADWNLISVPRITSDFSADFLFINRSSDVFGYTNSFVPRDTLAMGSGYWVKYNSPEVIKMAGVYVDSMAIQVNSAGWKLIGSITDTVSVTDLRTEPPNSLVGNIYFFNQVSRQYNIANEIRPGIGYWMKVNNPCRIIMRRFL